MPKATSTGASYQLGENPGQLTPHLKADGVPLSGPVDSDGSDGRLAIHQDVLGHQFSGANGTDKERSALGLAYRGRSRSVNRG